ncbi:MAG: prolipoprotein diacylglyceryl transferase [Actinomycetota bacterium]|nr:prolipoprotein diacylglyceryl transferase [Actinomycetota bacterium]
MLLTSIPSPADGVWNLGPVPLRAYAMCIIAGIFIAVWVGQRRWEDRGGDRALISDVAIWAVPFGIVGGRLYHVISSPDAYFGAGGNPIKAFAVWEGGLGIWGAIALGGVGAWIACRRAGVRLPPLADALAPGLALAQAAGRWGNWFNQELFGGPTSLPWALQIDPQFRPVGFEEVATFHPTFLYESLWNIGVALLVVWADRRWRLGHGRAFALYVAAYTVGRGWIEYLRIDPAEDVLGLRLNVWVSLLVLLGAIAYLVVSNRRHPGREAPETLRATAADPSQHAGEAGPAQ